MASEVTDLRRGLRKTLSYSKILTLAFLFGCVLIVYGQGTGFRNAPASAAQAKNPYAGDAQAAAGGKKLYAQNCAQCHGNNLQGMGPAPTLLSAPVKAAAPGELFWFITNGDLNKGMPGWPQLPKQQRWQIVSFLESKNGGH
jgi:mono/diheme cytochrome c family protein